MKQWACVAHASLAAGLLLTALAPRGALAQDDEVIVDPEAEGSSSAAVDDDESIVDPEAEGDDHGWGEAARIGRGDDGESEGAVDPDDEPDPQANTGLARIELDGRFGADLRQEGQLEDAYESRFRFDTEVEFRRSRRLRLSVGVRTDLLWALPAAGDPDLTYRYADATDLNAEGEPRRLRDEYTPLEQDRYELDIIPLSAYIDATAFDGFHLRLGIQPVSIARADFFSAIDMLAVYDQRGQPRLDPGTPRIPQPAVRLDWDLASWATLQAIYVPWFMPHYTRPNRDGTVAEQVGVAGGSVNPPIDQLLPPSYQTYASQAATRFVGPVPDFATPQAQVRLNFRGSTYEFGISGGTALEKFASVYMTPAFESYVRGDGDALAKVLEEYPIGDDDTNRLNAALAQTRFFDVAYERYYQVGIDGSVDVAPVTLAFELTYSPSRQLYAATADGAFLPQPNTTAPIREPRWSDEDGLTLSNVTDTSIRKGVPMVQGVAHLDWLHGETFGVALEMFWLQALARPHDQTRDWYAFKADKGFYLGGLLAATYRINDDRVNLSTSLATLLGPSIISVSQIEVRARDGFYLNLGAMFFEGPRVAAGAQAVSVGGLLSASDQVYLGFRYVP